MLLYNHSCVAHILFTLYCRLKETMNNTKTRCILDTKIATEALVYSYLLFQFLYAQNVSCRLLMTCSPYKSPFRSDFLACTSHFGIYLHGFAYIHTWLFVPVFFVQLRCGCFHEEDYILV